MAFPLDVVVEAWRRAESCCECTGKRHKHKGRCRRPLAWTLQGVEIDAGWRACRRAPQGVDDLGNCEIRCARCV
jgi:hypothetical protein